MTGPRTTTCHGGFTLIEALVGMALFGILMVGVLSLFASNNSVFDRSLGTAEAHQNARVAVDQLAREVRMAGYDLSGTIDTLSSPTPVQIGNAESVTFVADVDRDGTLDQVTYRLVGDEMRRESSSWSGSAFPSPSASVLATGVTGLTFSYFDDTQPTNVAITAPVSSAQLDDIRRIAASVVTTATTGGETRQFPLFVDVQLRN